MSTSPDCWLTFWSEDNYKNNTRTFTGPQGVPNLSEYTYTNSTYGMGDTVNSLKAGPQAWACLFKDSNYGSSALKVRPNAAIPNLSEAGGFRNDVDSFVQYEARPNFFDTGVDTLAGDCWLKLYVGERYTGQRYAIYGAGDIVNVTAIDGLPALIDKYYVYPTSLTTGPSTWVEIYNEYNFQQLMCRIGPNSLIPSLGPYGMKIGDKWDDYYRSIRVYSTEPEGFSTSGQKPNQVVALERYQTQQHMSNVLGTVLGMLPVGGNLLAGLQKALWPAGPGIMRIWTDMSNFMLDMAQGLINQNNVKQLNNILAGLYHQLDTYQQMAPGPQKAGRLQDLLVTLQNEQQFFLSQAHPETNLPYLVAFGSLSVAALAERTYNYALLSDGAADQNLDLARTKLDTTITQLQQAVATSVSGAHAWRLSQLAVTQQGKHGAYLLTDQYTGYSQEYESQTSAEAARQKMASYVGAQYQLLLDGYVSPAGVWGVFATTNTTAVAASGNTNFPTTAFTVAPALQPVRVVVPTYPNTTAGTAFANDSNGHRITGITLYASGANRDGFLTGILVSYDAQNSAIQGTTGASSVSVTFESDENIVAFYGGSGDYLDQVFFRTDKGRDFGIGGPGGTPFAVAGPQGVGATISQISGVKNVGGKYLGSLSITWQYDRYTMPAA